MTVHVALHGVAGRMGRAIGQAMGADPELELVGAIEREGSSLVGADARSLLGLTGPSLPITSSLDQALSRADVVIDFTIPDATVPLLLACAERRVAAVIGTTGLEGVGDEALDALSKVAPIVVAPNMSVGVTLLFHLAARAAELLGPGFDAEVVEMHHRNKVDAPSGTAVRLADGVARAKGLDPAQAIVHGRSGHVGARPAHEVGVMTLRGGDVVGDHTLVLAGPGERLELTHRAHGREIFAHGALRAARWVSGRPPARYDMADVIGVPR